MLRKLLILLACSTLFVTGSAAADEVVKWVDADGVTHFGNAQFAPREGAERVDLKEANGMDAPNLMILERAPEYRQLNGVVVERAHVKNPRGWRGYFNRPVERRERWRRR